MGVRIEEAAFDHAAYEIKSVTSSEKDARTELKT